MERIDGHDLDYGRSDGYGMKVCKARARYGRMESQIFLIGNWKSGKLHGDKCILFKRNKPTQAERQEFDKKKKEEQAKNKSNKEKELEKQQQQQKNNNNNNNNNISSSQTNDFISNICDESRIKNYSTLIIGKFEKGQFISGHIYYYKKSESNNSHVTTDLPESCQTRKNFCFQYHGHHRSLWADFEKEKKKQKEKEEKEEKEREKNKDKNKNKKLTSKEIWEKFKKLDWGIQSSDSPSTIGRCTIWHGYFKAQTVGKKVFYLKSDETKRPLLHINQRHYNNYMSAEERKSYGTRIIDEASKSVFEGWIDFFNGKKMTGVFNCSCFTYNEYNTSDYFDRLFVDGRDDVTFESGSIVWDNIFFKIDCRIAAQPKEENSSVYWRSVVRRTRAFQGIVFIKDLNKEYQNKNNNNSNNNSNNSNRKFSLLDYMSINNREKNNSSIDDIDMNSDESKDSSDDDDNSNSNDNDDNENKRDDDDGEQFELECQIMKRRYCYDISCLEAGFSYIGTFGDSSLLKPSGMGLIMKNNNRFCQFDQCFVLKQEHDKTHDRKVNKYLFKSKLVKKIIRHKNGIKSLLNDDRNMNSDDILCYINFRSGCISFQDYIQQYINVNKLALSIKYMKYIINKNSNNNNDDNDDDGVDDDIELNASDKAKAVSLFVGYRQIGNLCHKMATIDFQDPNSCNRNNYMNIRQKTAKEKLIKNGLVSLIDFVNKISDNNVKIRVSNHSDRNSIHKFLSCNNVEWINYVISNSVRNNNIGYCHYVHLEKDKYYDMEGESSWKTLHYCCFYNYKDLFDKCMNGIDNLIKEINSQKKHRGYGLNKIQRKNQIIDRSVLHIDNCGFMAIHIAAQYGRDNMISKLLSAYNSNGGMRTKMFTQRTKEGWCAAALSIIFNHVKCFKLFWSNLARKYTVSRLIVKKDITGFNGFSIIELCFQS